MAPSASVPTNGPQGQPCRWCGTVFLARKGPGRPRQYCGQSCRQQHYIERRTAVGDGRDPNRVVIERSTFEHFESKRLQLRLALDDLDRLTNNGDAPPPGMEWIIEHARSVVALELRPPSDSPQ